MLEGKKTAYDAKLRPKTGENVEFKLFLFPASPSPILGQGKCNICGFHEEIHVFEDWIFVRLSSLVLVSEQTTNRKKFIV